MIVFFAISGYLVTQSWTRDPRAGAFAAKRGLRLLPALVVVVALSAYALGPIVTTLPLSRYLGASETHRYVIDNDTLRPVYDLPGVFAGNPLPAVNGSLWTLPIEARAYVLLAIVALAITAVRRRSLGPLVPLAWLAAAAVAVVVVVVAASHADASVREYGIQRPSAQDLLGTATLRFEATFLLVFAVSALLFLLRRRIVPRPLPGALLLAAGAVAYAAGAGRVDGLDIVLPALVFPYVVLVLGLCTPVWIHHLTRPGDVSYGVYLLAFPVQQVLVQVAGDGLAPGVLFVASLAVSYLLALPLWHLVERPSLRHKPRAPARSEPVSTPIAA